FEAYGRDGTAVAALLERFQDEPAALADAPLAQLRELFASPHFPRAYLDKQSYDFSFSGIKTAVNRYIQKHKDQYKEKISDIVAAFQEAVVEVLCFKIIHAAKSKGYQHLSIVGGAAANSHLRQMVDRQARKENIAVYIPSLSLCGDNAAMVASAGYHRLLKGEACSRDADVYSRAAIH
ncbi:MAG: hypothetical protein R6U27_00335, partial [Desulfobacterales bacterium]